MLGRNQFFSHITAAHLWGMPLPPWFADEPLHVSASEGWREPRDPTIRGHRLQMPADQVRDLDGMHVASPHETWCQLGGALTLDDLVAAGDFAIGRGELSSVGELRTALGRVRRAGAPVLREALPLLRPESESSPESRLRIAILAAGLPMPELQWILTDRRGGFVARLDLAYPAYRIAVEYDGRHHSDHAQFVRDADRWALIGDEGWIIVRVLSHHLADGSAVHRIHRALRSRGWR